MRTVGIKVLKNKLSEYVRAAEAGETVLVTDRNRVVAELKPPRTEIHPLLQDPFFARGVREGWLSLPTETGPLTPPPKGIMTLDDLMKELDRDREDRF
jgi:antitoxin (DNA-binding transcriptional repressor) of toxin-antitoxin stability system